MIITGTNSSAKVFTDDIEEEAVKQIEVLMNHPISKHSHTRIMPDVHAGAGCVIGYTARLTDVVVPNLIGVDLGCGVLGMEIEGMPSFEKIDKFINGHIPSGLHVRNHPYNKLEEACEELGVNYKEFTKNVLEIVKETKQNKDYVFDSLGTLGGGNHFIEIDRGDSGNYLLTVHSGSRNFGLKIAKFFQDKAYRENNLMPKEEYTKKIQEIKQKYTGKDIELAIKDLRKEQLIKKMPAGLEYLSGNSIKDYLYDMRVAQVYAKLNRYIMVKSIIDHFQLKVVNTVESVHNYIDFEDNIVRKGAIRAHKGEQVIIPLSMAFGVIIGTGLGNPEWNYSAPHGAGRRMSRTKARKTLSLDKFKKSMDGIYSSTVNIETIDEAPMAYKDAEEIIEKLKDTVKIEKRLKPVYNFKGFQANEFTPAEDDAMEL